MRTKDADRQGDGPYPCILNIYVSLLADIGKLSGVPLGSPDDLTYEWVLKEGPKLDKALLLFLEGSGGLPEIPDWLTPLWDRFASSNDAKYLRWIRQCLLFCYKVELEPTNEQLQEAQKAFEESDADVGVWDSHFSVGTPEHCPFYSTARRIVGRVSYAIDWGTILPSHGPGAVYPSVPTHEKSKFSTIYSTIEQHYPYYEYMCALPNYVQEHASTSNTDLRLQDDILCHLVAVPKDSRGPRLICVHPKEAIWIQQGCRRLLEHAIESPRALTHGYINFRDQGVNGSLALSSSLDQEFCTLDLKEASDRISCKLVKFLFGNYTYEKLSCSRANKVRLLDDRVIELRKWAPMGNCLTFPVQSLIFYSLVRAGIRCRYGTDCSDIYVFGDDILFPRKFYDGAVNGLIRAGLIPNLGKTFRHGFFRESCGVDAYRGIDVTPHRLRRLDSSSVSGAMSICSLAKAMKIDGYHHTSEHLYRQVQEYWGQLPLGNNPDAQGLYRYEDCDLGKLLLYEKSIRFNRRLHKWQTRLRLVRGVSHDVSRHAWWHVQDSILRLVRKDESEFSFRGLEYAVPYRERLQHGWADVVMTSAQGMPKS